jgi:hypothetical protein
VPVRERFMPQAFHDAGYQTAITGKWNLGHGYKKFLPRSRGFDHAYGHVNGAIDYFRHERDGGLGWNRDGNSRRHPLGCLTHLAAPAGGFARSALPGRRCHRRSAAHSGRTAPRRSQASGRRRLERTRWQCDRRRDPLAAVARSGLERDVTFSVLDATEDPRRDFSGASPPTD